MYRRITLLLFVSVSLLSGQASAQDLLPTISGQRVDLYEYARNMMQSAGLEQPPKMINELPHAIFRYEGNTINASQLNQNLAGATAFKSESYTLTLPNLTGMIDTLVMMVGVPGVDDERIVSTVIIGNMRDKLAYYVDYNHNFDFTDDGSFLFFTKKEKASLVKINKAGVSTSYEYILFDLALVPEYLATLDVRLINAPRAKEKKEPKFAVPYLSRSSRLNLQFSFLTGSGDMRFAYNNLEDVNKEYSAAIDAISRFTMSASYAFQHLNVGATVAIEANQIGREEQYVTDLNDPSDKLINYNIGNWSRTRFIYGVFAEYDIRLIRNSYLTPYFFIFRYNHLSEEGFAGYGSEIDEASPFNSVFTNRMGRQFGAKLKLPMSEKVLAVLDIGYTRNGFDLAEGFIQETHAPTSVITEHGTINYGVGVQFLLFNGKGKVSKNLPAEKKL
jgi:hypothetical protein